MSDTQKVQDEVHDVINDIEDAAHDAKNKVKDAAHDAKNMAKDAAHDAKNKADDAAHDAKNAVKDAANQAALENIVTPGEVVKRSRCHLARSLRLYIRDQLMPASGVARACLDDGQLPG